MLLLFISLLSFCADHYGAGILVHVVFCYALLMCIILVLPRIKTPYLMLYIVLFWAGIGLLSFFGVSFPYALLNDFIYWLRPR